MKTKKVVIHQPDFIPYLGFFDRLLQSDLFIALDHVQFVNSSRGWTNRDKIKTQDGAQWLTVSVKKTSRNTRINEVQLAVEPDWRSRHINALYQNYRAAPYFDQIIGRLNSIYKQDFKTLSEFNMALIEMLMDMLDVRLPWILSSTMDPKGSKNQLLVDLLKKVSATHYVSGMGAKDYFDPKPFSENGIEVIWQRFESQVYPQQFESFIPNLTSLDLLFNMGLTESRKILRRQK